ncbi:MAG: hypothetical protein RBR35_17830 [Salinivirgaceae bacterium]|nr:hypothetical protein [Salinivirgaceae bacterium]
MIDYKTLVTTEQIDTLEALDGLTGEEISDLYGCPMCGSVNWERYSYEHAGTLYLDELRCATCKTPAPDDSYLEEED